MDKWLLSTQAVITQFILIVVAATNLVIVLTAFFRRLDGLIQWIRRILGKIFKKSYKEETMRQQVKPQLRPVLKRTLLLVAVISAFGAAAIWGGRSVVLAQNAVKAPFSVNGYFVPSGFMGDGEKDPTTIDLNDGWKGNCSHPGPTCIRIVYHPRNTGWAGVYWQYPDKNWGDEPGRAVESAKKVIFWARGERGGELVRFKAGGINARGKKFHDSFERIHEPPVVELTTEWQRFEIDLAGADTSSVLGAFEWSADRRGNPDGLTFYLDGIRYE